METRLLGLICLVLLSTLTPQPSTYAQGSAFTYQGRLTDRSQPANGTYDLRFTLNGAATGPAQIGSAVTNAAMPVSNGLFTVTLDFGAGVFTGDARWLEVAVRTNDGADFAALTPRQPITPAPYALTALSANAVSATNLIGVLPMAQLPASVITNHAAGVTLLGTFSGDGGGLAVSATNIFGVIQSAQLPAAAVTNNATGVTLLGTFSGDGWGLTNLPGASWRVIPGTSQQAVANIGYLATNEGSQVTLTLPASANIGDVIRISGAGGGGWKVLQNSGQLVSSGNLTAEIGAVWRPQNSGNLSQALLACSADGTKIFAALQGSVLVSLDSGTTWTLRPTSQNFVSLACSSDGARLAATVYGGGIYLSGDSGVHWAQSSAPTTNWLGVASSIDGAKLVAVVNMGPIYTSTNAGVTWAQSGAPLTNWVRVVSSADGTKLVAAPAAGFLYVSGDSGATWTARLTDTVRAWRVLASSWDGIKLFALSPASPWATELYVSGDSGASWGMINGTVNINNLASSADGTRLVATVSPGQLYTSKDSGVSWTPRASGQAWVDVASSADGTTLAATVEGGPIYTSSPSVPSTTAGVTGYLSGGQDTAIELQYVGNGRFVPLSHEGIITAY